MQNYKWGVGYLLSIVAINLAFLLIPPFSTPWGMASVGAVGIGFVYITRDAAQRVYGPKKVLGLMAIGIIITSLMSWKLALASGTAFAIGEGIEWAIFTYTGKPFRQRVAWSVPPAVVADTAVFLLVAGFFSWPNMIFETASKLIALVWIFWLRDPKGEA